jgi:WD40-like Beta Propeller Repeat
MKMRLAAITLLLFAPESGAKPLQMKSGVVMRWTVKGISSESFESHAAIDPRTGDFWFVRSAPDFTGWRILVSHCAGSSALDPATPKFASKGLEADPGFSPDGRFLYYISTRATSSMKSRDLDIWRVDRRNGLSWSAPERLPTPVNSGDAEWFPRQSVDGWLYFGSNREGGFGGNDIWRARQNAAGKWRAENAGPNVNSALDEYEPLPSPDGRTLIIETSDGYYISRLEHGVWSRREKLDREINANGSEIGAIFSPRGQSLLFGRDTGKPESGEFFLWRFGRAEEWPKICRANTGQ